MNKLELGQVVMTIWISESVREGEISTKDLLIAIGRHRKGDWGDVELGDKELNDLSISEGGRIISAYNIADKKIWIITEADRSSTTILFPEEY